MNLLQMLQKIWHLRGIHFYIHTIILYYKNKCNKCNKRYNTLNINNLGVTKVRYKRVTKAYKE
jgi:hypothetical protein